MFLAYLYSKKLEMAIRGITYPVSPFYVLVYFLGNTKTYIEKYLARAMEILISLGMCETIQNPFLALSTTNFTSVWTSLFPM